MRIDDWFLAAGQRGNRHSAIDRRHDGVPWTEGNLAEILVDGSEYFTRLYSTLCATALGDSVYLTGLEGDADERLAGPDTEVAGVLADLVQRGVHVRGLVWQSHGASYSEEKNLMFSRAVNTAGGDVLLDNRIRRGGSHHQKLVVVRRENQPADDIAFVGGMDLVHGRHDDDRHLGDPQPADLDPGDYGERPGWHDVQVALVGPAVDDVAFTFRERWEDPAPLDSRNPLRWALHRLSRQPTARAPLAAERVDPPRVRGGCAREQGRVRRINCKRVESQ
jgi:phosphatidylserine/phosphatidylglycerophosphate/cardiolipin synthase-like enzyme